MSTKSRTPVYLFVGSIIMGDYWWKYTAGSIVALVGIGYVVLEYVPSIEPPANMRFVSLLLVTSTRLWDCSDARHRDADAGWGAEQV